MCQFVNTKLDKILNKRQINGILINREVSNDDLSKAPDTAHEIPNVPMNQHTMFFSPTNEAKILRIILEIKNKVGGCDGIHALVLELAAPHITPVLAHIINNVMSSGICPNHFKQSEIRPMPKSSSKIQLNNYRPIESISHLAKI